MKVKVYFRCLIIAGAWFTIGLGHAQTSVVISDPQTWKRTDLSAYVGKTITFESPFYVCNNSSSLYIAPRLIFSPTNQAAPLSDDYNSILQLNAVADVRLTGAGDHRLGERVEHLKVKVSSTSTLQYVSGEWVGNTRADLLKGLPLQDIDLLGTHTLLVCAMNLEYYLTSHFGEGYGPDNATEHTRQRSKIRAALSLINADVYGLVEIQQGQDALAEIASDLTSATGRHFSYINDGGSVDGTYTKSGYVYCSDVVTPFGTIRHNDSQVRNRKKMQAFRMKKSGETFIFSLNHFKAKTGSGTGDDANQYDGQGCFNGTRVREAHSVVEQGASAVGYFGDPDILLMGDLNAYGKEDPIEVLTQAGYIDLHRYCHADSSYSYRYRDEIGYLDHALCNSTLLPQVTGMVAFHINSDESDSYTYDKSSDLTMFRSSDHDPVVVGLRLDSTAQYHPEVYINNYAVRFDGSVPCISNAQGGYLFIYRTDGQLVLQTRIDAQQFTIPSLSQGVYIVLIYGQGTCHPTKLIVP